MKALQEFLETLSATEGNGFTNYYSGDKTGYGTGTGIERK